jgi:phosphohistidine phosphatase
MARERLIPDRILVSPALRTRETYEALAQTLAAKPTFSAALYMASPEAVWDAAVRSGGSTVLVIGHNPGLHELAAGLIAQAHDRSAAGRTLAEHLPTASLAAFSVTGERLDAAGPRLLAYWSPKD